MMMAFPTPSPLAMPLGQTTGLAFCNVQGCSRYAKCRGSCLLHASAFPFMPSPTASSVAPSFTSISPSSASHHSHRRTSQSPTSSCCSSSSPVTDDLAKSRRCFIANCPKFARIGGLCTQHNMQLSNQRRKCSIQDCTSYARTSGLCIRHGGGKLCSVDGCNTVQQSGGLCRAHGGGSKCKPCKFAGCTHFARVGGLCGQHKKAKQQMPNEAVVLVERV
ncbi:Aste57867_23517 [Aphanomyces stellatus]|uniref:Aste57867_23517 protein n=1 Tax=Aphanomyces stellatus TaxID=120398 RepID=A0A485LSG2_9STRA|nr:hypothetical protein As57867_023446 [Aphanomyces stellatus]VFU00162.1 Aste57867_23517 [Aphanomyces stellatus]